MIKNKHLTRILACLLLMVFTTQVWAQGAEAPAAAGATSDAGSANDPVVKQTVGDVGLVVGMGAAGAIVGLSTLSFYEKPKEHWKNVTMGGAIGVILGVAVVAYLQATRTQDYDDEEESEESAKYFDSQDRQNWHNELFAKNQSTQPSFALNFNF